MFTLAVTLIAVGAVLAALGTLGFYCVAATAPDPHDLKHTRTMATTGRRLVYLGIAAIALAHPLVLVLAAVGFAAAASYLSLARLEARAAS